MWKQWQVKGGKECGKVNSNNKGETSLAEADAKNKGKKKGDKDKDKDPKKKETRTCNHCQKKGHIEANCWQKDPPKMPEKFAKKKDAKIKKAGAAVKEEHPLLVINVEYEYNNEEGVMCFDMNEAFDKVPIIDGKVFLRNEAFITAPVVENEAFVRVELGLEEEDVDNEDELNDASQIRPTLQALNSPNMLIGDTGATKHLTKHFQGRINA